MKMKYSVQLMGYGVPMVLIGAVGYGRIQRNYNKGFRTG
jgi:hypothetical protein